MSRTITHPALAPLKQKFPDAGLKAGEFRDMVTIVVPREHIVPVCTFLRDDPGLRFDLLSELNGVDYLNFPGAPHRFAVNYGLSSVEHNNRLWLKVFLDPTQDTAPRCEASLLRDEEVVEKGDVGLKLDSACGVWPGAEWMEREVYDMFGVGFEGHLELKRILLPDGWKGHPLRKDYPILQQDQEWVKANVGIESGQ